MGVFNEHSLLQLALFVPFAGLLDSLTLVHKLHQNSLALNRVVENLVLFDFALNGTS